ncbi:membrane protein insertase YidC [Corynebacterium hindlerae]|uniref:membrane protein insertase YidC n=1 Tax=Corynebacterium hindlerae TaxID=699041 RepID=UPI001AD684D4|nr:membrane protein insertase YidC [Corynebacterium hindlerae]QTH60009.1 membrane protein insertase YidC [Corynebacterium hindlerae]
MIEFMIYPVSAVMKFWHWLLSSVFGVAPDMAWLLSIFGLIITVRSIIAPTSWLQMKAGRVGLLLKPKFTELKKEFESRTDADATKWHLEKRKELQKEHSYSPLAGCLPVLIQVPVFLGLYQVLLRMARPAEGLDSSHQPIGFLSPTDVAEFLQVRFMDVPLPTYIAMSDERLAMLGTDKQSAIDVIMPLVFAACLFTSTNLAFSTWRSYRTLDWSVGFSVHMIRMLISMVFLVPIMLLFSAITAPLPLAVMLYWFGGNLWTMAQFFFFTWLLEKKYPLSEEYIEFRDTAKAAFKERQADLKKHKRLVRKHRLLMLLQPHKMGTHRRTISEAKDAKRSEKVEATREKKERAKQRRAAEREARQQRLKEKQEARAERRAAKRRPSSEDQME